MTLCGLGFDSDWSTVTSRLSSQDHPAEPSRMLAYTDQVHQFLEITNSCTDFPNRKPNCGDCVLNIFEQIHIDNLLAERTAEACTIMHQCGHGYAVEQPLGSKTSSVSMFDLQCFNELKKLGAKSVDFHQCMFGAVSTKPTRFLYWNGRFETLASTCNHPRTVEVTPGIWTAHPAIVGIKDANGRFKTRSSAAYPDRLNRWVAAVINLAVSRPAPC